jgi:hypothetical protein
MPQCKDCEPIIAVHYQPDSKMAQWKAIGVNTLIGIEREGYRTEEYVRQKARDNGLKYISAVPSADPAVDETDPSFIGYMLPDEPDGHKSPLSSWSNAYNALKTAGRKKPVFGNFAGPLVTAAYPAYDGKPSADWAGHRAFVPYADWLGHDWYPINSIKSRYWTPFNGPGLITRSMDLLSKWSGGKPQLAYVECSFMNKQAESVSPTCDEVKQIIDAIWNHPSAIGVILFPQRIQGNPTGTAYSFSYDNTTPDMRTCLAAKFASMMPQPTPKAAKHILYNDGTWSTVS